MNASVPVVVVVVVVDTTSVQPYKMIHSRKVKDSNIFGIPRNSLILASPLRTAHTPYWSNNL